MILKKRDLRHKSNGVCVSCRKRPPRPRTSNRGPEPSYCQECYEQHGGNLVSVPHGAQCVARYALSGRGYEMQTCRTALEEDRERARRVRVYRRQVELTGRIDWEPRKLIA